MNLVFYLAELIKGTFQYTSRGTERANHKYIRRQLMPNGKFRYWYYDPSTGQVYAEDDAPKKGADIHQKDILYTVHGVKNGNMTLEVRSWDSVKQDYVKRGEKAFSDAEYEKFLADHDENYEENLKETLKYTFGILPEQISRIPDGKALEKDIPAIVQADVFHGMLHMAVIKLKSDPDNTYLLIGDYSKNIKDKSYSLVTTPAGTIMGGGSNSDARKSIAATIAEAEANIKNKNSKAWLSFERKQEKMAKQLANDILFQNGKIGASFESLAGTCPFMKFEVEYKDKEGNTRKHTVHRPMQFSCGVESCYAFMSMNSYISSGNMFRKLDAVKDKYSKAKMQQELADYFAAEQKIQRRELAEAKRDPAERQAEVDAKMAAHGEKIKDHQARKSAWDKLPEEEKNARKKEYDSQAAVWSKMSRKEMAANPDKKPNAAIKPPADKGPAKPKLIDPRWNPKIKPTLRFFSFTDYRHQDLEPITVADESAGEWNKHHPDAGARVYIISKTLKAPEAREDLKKILELKNINLSLSIVPRDLKSAELKKNIDDLRQWVLEEGNRRGEPLPINFNFTGPQRDAPDWVDIIHDPNFHDEREHDKKHGIWSNGDARLCGQRGGCRECNMCEKRHGSTKYGLDQPERNDVFGKMLKSGRDDTAAIAPADKEEEDVKKSFATDKAPSADRPQSYTIWHDFNPMPNWMTMDNYDESTYYKEGYLPAVEKAQGKLMTFGKVNLYHDDKKAKPVQKGFKLSFFVKDLLK